MKMDMIKQYVGHQKHHIDHGIFVPQCLGAVHNLRLQCWVGGQKFDKFVNVYGIKIVNEGT